MLFEHFGPMAEADETFLTKLGEAVEGLLDGLLTVEAGLGEEPALEFILRHQLPAPSSIKMALKSLQDKEFLFYDTEQGYMVYDRFFGMWLKRLAGL